MLGHVSSDHTRESVPRLWYRYGTNDTLAHHPFVIQERYRVASNPRPPPPPGMPISLAARLADGASRTLEPFGIYAGALARAAQPVAHARRNRVAGTALDAVGRVAHVTTTPLLQWIAAALVLALGILGLVVVGYDELTGRALDPTALYLLTFILGVLTSILNLNVGVQLGQRIQQTNGSTQESSKPITVPGKQ